MEDSKRDVIEYYFNLKYSNETILVFLERFHGIKLSLRTLKRRLRLFGLRRRGNVIDEGTIRQAITTEISGPAQLQGYRSMWHTLRLKYQLHVPRSTVARPLREIDRGNEN